MKLTVNGSPYEHEQVSTVDALLRELGADPQHVAILHNDHVVKRGDFGATRLTEGDRVEVMTLIGGG
jgi:thiamine biosynthesis protein ThiS